MAEISASAVMASMTSSSVKPVRRRSLILGQHAEALERVVLGPLAVLPGHRDQEVIQAMRTVQGEIALALELLLPPGAARAEPLLGDARVVARRALREVLGWKSEQPVHRRACLAHRAGLARRAIHHPETRAEDLQA